MYSSVPPLLRALADHVEHARQVLDFADELAHAVGGGRARARVADLRTTHRRLENTLLTERAVVAAALTENLAAHDER